MKKVMEFTLNSKTKGRRPKDITGQRFGKLTAIRPLEERRHRNVVWECLCDCGNYKKATQPCLAQGHTSSCGCIAVGSKLGIHAEGTVATRIAKNPLNKNNRTGITGVSYITTVGQYEARLTFKGIRYNLGRYNTLEEATKVRKQAEKQIFKPFIEWYSVNYPRPLMRRHKVKALR